MRGVVVIWVALTLVFIAIRLLPGDALTAVDATTNAERRAQQRAELGLDAPLSTQYARYMGRVWRGDWGQSLVTSENVIDMILVRLGPTLALGIGSFGIALGLGVMLGVATLTHGLIGHLASGTIIVSQSVPYYVTALLAIYLCSLQLRLLPASGSTTPLHLVLPCSVLGFHTASSIAYVLSQNLKDVYTQPFMLTAHAKGLPPIDAFEHAIRLALLPTLSVIAVQAGFLLSGTVVIETIFVRRGLGTLLLRSVIDRDYPVVQALTILGTMLYTLALASSSLLLRLFDPRLS